MTKYAAYGTLYKINDGGGLDTVAQVRNISGPGMSMEPIDVTNHGSTSAWKEYVAGLLDGGEITLDILYDPAEDTHEGTGSTGILYFFKNRTILPCGLTFPNSTAWTFNAWVTGFEPGMPHDGELSASVTFQITGAPTLA